MIHTVVIHAIVIHAIEVAFESIQVSGPEPTELSQPGIPLRTGFTDEAEQDGLIIAQKMREFLEW